MAVAISIVTITIIAINNEWLKKRLSNRCSLPMPIELIAVILGTLSSRLFLLNANYNVRTIGFIPTGFPGNYFRSMDRLIEPGVGK